MERIPKQNKTNVGLFLLVALIFINACAPSQEISPPTSSGKNICTPESRLGDVCIEVAKPVCGFDSNDKQIQTYGNSCFACKDEKVSYWKEGMCIQETQITSSEETTLDDSVKELDEIKDL